MSNSDHNSNKHAVFEEEIPVSVESQSSSQDPAKVTARLDRLRNGLREHPFKAAIVIVTLLVILIVIAAVVRNAFLYEDTDDAQVDGHVMPLSARINGQVMKVNFVEGQLVHEGDLLAVIDPADFKISVIQAEAALADAKASATSSRWNVPITSVTSQSNLDSAETEVVNAEAGVRGAEHSYESAKASLAQDEANAAKSDADLERAKQLVAKEDISRQQFDQAVASAAANQAGVASADAAVKAGNVTLFRLHLAMALGGKGFVLMTGDVASLEAAVAAGCAVARRDGILVDKAVIPSPSREVFREFV